MCGYAARCKVPTAISTSRLTSPLAAAPSGRSSRARCRTGFPRQQHVPRWFASWNPSGEAPTLSSARAPHPGVSTRTGTLRYASRSPLPGEPRHCAYGSRRRGCRSARTLLSFSLFRLFGFLAVSAVLLTTSVHWRRLVLAGLDGAADQACCHSMLHWVVPPVRPLSALYLLKPGKVHSASHGW